LRRCINHFSAEIRISKSQGKVDVTLYALEKETLQNWLISDDSQIVHIDRWKNRCAQGKTKKLRGKIKFLVRGENSFVHFGNAVVVIRKRCTVSTSSVDTFRVPNFKTDFKFVDLTRKIVVQLIEVHNFIYIIVIRLFFRVSFFLWGIFLSLRFLSFPGVFLGHQSSVYHSYLFLARLFSSNCSFG
jgi:hypothetical protein